MHYKKYLLLVDLLEENHILIAGATGSGKSVLLNALIYHIMGAGHRLILLDPKKVELHQYEDTLNCIIYADEKDSMVAALQEAVRIIDSRYREMKLRNEKKYPGERIYVVVDELADLMLTAKKQVLPMLQRIAQIGRAAEVHLIAATQCPLREVIPTTLKANFDCRIGLRTACAQDSRNIVGVKGCELLPNPKREHIAHAWIRRGADIELWQIPMIQDDVMTEMINYRKRGQRKSETKKKKGFLEILFGM